MSEAYIILLLSLLSLQRGNEETWPEMTSQLGGSLKNGVSYSPALRLPEVAVHRKYNQPPPALVRLGERLLMALMT